MPPRYLQRPHYSMKALISSDIWSDPDFENLSANAKLIVFWLFTSSSRDNAGVVRMSDKRIAFECSVEDPGEVIAEAITSGSFVVQGDRIWIKNWISKQIGGGDALIRNNMMKSVQKCLVSYPAKLKRQIYKRYPELLASPLEGGGEPPRKGQGKDRIGREGIGKDKDKEKETPPPATKAKQIDEFAGDLAGLYGSSIAKINPESKRVVWDRGITKDECARVLLYVKRHRAGNLKDEPLIPTTANRALLNIGDLIERAFAADLPSKKDFVAKPMPEIPKGPPPTAQELKAIKEGLAALKEKMRQPNRKKENE